jgi:hypothetical protein
MMKGRRDRAAVESRAASSSRIGDHTATANRALTRRSWRPASSPMTAPNFLPTELLVGAISASKLPSLTFRARCLGCYDRDRLISLEVPPAAGT